MKKPLRFYRVWCGRKCYSAWLPDRKDAYRIAAEHGIAFLGDDAVVHLGPLTRIEVGERTYARSRTVPISSK